MPIGPRQAGSPRGPEGAGYVHGPIVQFGGQTPLNLAQGLTDAGVPILGTSPASIHLAEDRQRFQQVLHELGLRQPPNGIAFSRAEAADVAEQLGYPSWCGRRTCSAAAACRSATTPPTCSATSTGPCTRPTAS